MEGQELRDIEEALKKLPLAVIDEYRAASEVMGQIMDGEEMVLWAKEGLVLATDSPRSWEPAVEYFKASPAVARYLPLPAFLQWAHCGSYLCQESPALAVAYFRASPEMVGNLHPQYIPKWASLGRSLYKGTWKSVTLASRFFEASPPLAKSIPFWDMELFVVVLEALSFKSYDMAMDCLAMGPEVLARMGKEREGFLNFARALVETNWREVRVSFEVASKAIFAVEENQRGRFLKLSEALTRAGYKDAASFLSEGAQAMSRVSPSTHKRLLDLCENMLPLCPEAVPAFLRSLPQVLERISSNQLPNWFQQGMQLLQENPEGGLAFFKLESVTAERVLESLSSSLELERVSEVLRLYCRALSGARIEVQSTRELVSKGIGWVNEAVASTDGTRVFLPPVVDRYPSKRDNFAWFKVVATHQVTHLEFGSFDFSFDRPATVFKDWRPLWEARNRKGSKGSEVVESNGQGDNRWLTDMARLFSLMKDRQLAQDIFSVSEDARLDHRVKAEYRGIVKDYQRVESESLKERPPIHEMPLQQAMVELLIRISLGQSRNLPVPKDYQKEARMMARILRRLFKPSTTVEDAAEATLRLYAIISRLPNQQVPEGQWQSEDFDQEDGEDYSEEELEQMLSQLGEGEGEDDEAKETEEESYQSPKQVDYRGDFKPELVQLLAKLREKQAEGQGKPLSQEVMEQLLQESADLAAEAGQLAGSVNLFAHNLMKEAGVPPPQSTPGQGHGPIAHEEESGGPLEAREPKTYVYDEWDFRAADYKPRWCIVREKIMDAGDIQFYNDTLRSYASLMEEIRRQFELVIPESFRKIRRLKDGEDLDLDAIIEASVDRMIGITPSEKVYWRRNKIERDVAVVFLLDMSASTAEAIDDGRHSGDSSKAPDDPVEYMMWLRNRREGALRRHYKRIIDLEKESTALLIQALESIGDSYGLYGFSGYGRENVEFYVIKDLEEPFSDRVKRRVDKITPLHATRMGPAIRHATSKLAKQEAKTKILFLISDGRPQDRGYSREGVEKEYAVHDTHMALVEARRQGITPFCLTVDKAGHDYLKAMCGDMGYEVLDDVWQLPRHLPLLYRRLTI